MFEKLMIWCEKTNVRYGLVVLGFVLLFICESYSPKGTMLELSETPLSSLVWLLVTGLSPLPLMVGMLAGRGNLSRGPLIAGTIGSGVLIAEHIWKTNSWLPVYMVCAFMGYAILMAIAKVSVRSLFNR